MWGTEGTGPSVHINMKDEAIQSMEKNLTTGSVPKTMAYFALPYLLSYFLQTLYGMADLFIIGQFCGNDAGATTAVANGSQVMHMLTVILVGLAMGTTVVIGKVVGVLPP